MSDGASNSEKPVDTLNGNLVEHPSPLLVPPGEDVACSGGLPDSKTEARCRGATSPLLVPTEEDGTGGGGLPQSDTEKEAHSRPTVLSPGEGAPSLSHDPQLCSRCRAICTPSPGSLPLTHVTPLEDFTTKKHGKQKVPRRLKKFYKNQDKLIEMYEETLSGAPQEDNEKTQRHASILAKVILLLNLMLLIAKVVAAAMSGSMSIVAAVVDSAVDLVSGILIWWSNRAMQKSSKYRYPQGRTRLEPISIIILSVIMAVASVLVIKESIEQIVNLAKSAGGGPRMEVSTIVICVVTIVTKFVLFILCYRIKSPSTQVLGQDQRNDVISNTVALAGGFIGARWWKFADPIGALIISLYIIIGWVLTGKEHIKQLSGHVADPAVITRVTWISMNFDPKIQALETVRVYHVGTNFLAEVHLVLPGSMTLKQGHDIGEGLQMKLEEFPDIERAFVHVDYETEHRPENEHKAL